jgi:cytochrome c553
MPFVVSTRDAGRRAADAHTLAEAADATAMMLTQCGDCHRAVGVGIVPSAPIRPDVGGLVGHMLDHQRAVDHMLLGLIVPSASEWQDGLARLQGAALKPENLPVDSRLTSEIDAAEARVHAMAKARAGLDSMTDRSATYSLVLTTCAQCHGLHSRVWGPTPTTGR